MIDRPALSERNHLFSFLLLLFLFFFFFETEASKNIPSRFWCQSVLDGLLESFTCYTSALYVGEVWHSWSFVNLSHCNLSARPLNSCSSRKGYERTPQIGEDQIDDWQVPGLIPDSIDRNFFFSRINFLCCLLFHVCSTPCYHSGTLDPSHSSYSASDRLHWNIHTPLIQRSMSRRTMLSRCSMGTY